MQASNTEVAVVGGGVIGCSIAYHLAKRGTKVTLLEQRSLASAASGASAGGVRQQHRDLRELPLAIRAIERWKDLEEELGADIHYLREGNVRTIEDESSLSLMESSVQAQREVGLDVRIVGGDELKALVPGLSTSVIAGTYTENDGHANPILTTHAFANAAKRAGAEICTGTRVNCVHTNAGKVTGVETSEGFIGCDWMVLAAGLWSPQLASQLGIDLPIEGFAPQMIATNPMPHMLHQVLSAATRRLSLKQIPNGNYVIGGGWPGEIDLEEGVAFANLESILGSVRDSSAVFPELRNASIERIWVGVEALTKDEIPILGALPGVEQISAATGFSGHGFALSPIIGQLISELVIDGTPSMPIHEFGMERFEGKEDMPWLRSRRAG